MWINTTKKYNPLIKLKKITNTAKEKIYINDIKVKNYLLNLMFVNLKCKIL